MKFKKVIAILIMLISLLSFGLVGCEEGEIPEAKIPANPPIKNSAEATTGIVSPEEIIDKEDDWIPDIIVGETGAGIPTVNDSQKYDYSAENVIFKSVCGTFEELVENDLTSYLSTSSNAIYYCDSVAFPYGTLSCNVKTKTNTDSGIIFGVSSQDENFWEGKGISYYFFFLSVDGTAYLGKTDNGNWHILKYVGYSFNAINAYNLKVVYYGGKICCYVNGEFLIGYRDKNPLSGTGFGFRTGATGVVFSELSITNDYLY